MHTIDRAAIKKVEHLIRIKLTPEEEVLYMKSLEGILDWVEGLNKVNTDGITPLYSANVPAMPMRDDIITDGNIRDAVLSNAPDAMNGYFAVPKVVE